MEIWKQNSKLLNIVILIELFEIMKTKEEILSITRLGKKKEGSCRPVLVEVKNVKCNGTSLEEQNYCEKVRKVTVFTFHLI